MHEPSVSSTSQRPTTAVKFVTLTDDWTVHCLLQALTHHLFAGQSSNDSVQVTLQSC
jgi:hypothetical protein